jgi:hypothetical protein
LLNTVSNWFSSIPNLLTEEVSGRDASSSRGGLSSPATSLPDTEEVLGAVTQQVDHYSRKVRCRYRCLGLARSAQPAAGPGAPGADPSQRRGSRTRASSCSTAQHLQPQAPRRKGVHSQ